MWLGGGLEGDVVAEGFEAADVAAFLDRAMPLGDHVQRPFGEGVPGCLVEVGKRAVEHQSY